MGREEHRRVPSQPLQQVEYVVAALRVETGGGLVEDQQFGIGDQGLGDPESLALAAGEGTGPTVLLPGQAGLVEQLVHPAGAARDPEARGDARWAT